MHLIKNQRKPTHMALFDSPNLAEVATGYGAIGRTVRTESELREAVTLVGKGDRPLLLDVRINGTVMHRMYEGKSVPLSASK